MEHWTQGQTLLSLKKKKNPRVQGHTCPQLLVTVGNLNWFLKRKAEQDQDSWLRWQKAPLSKGSEKELGKPISQDIFPPEGPSPHLSHPARVPGAGIFGPLLVVS